MTTLLRRKKFFAVAALTLLLLSMAVRVVYFRQFNDGPGIWQHLWTESDMYYFDSWANKIAAGDILSANVEAPLHGWQIQFAEDYAGRYLNRDSAGPMTREEAGDLWEGWMGRGSFYQDPLYPYLMAALYRIGGYDHRWVLVFQQVVGFASILLLYGIARRAFGRSVGLVTLALSLLYPLALYYELFLLRETLLLFFCLGLILLSQQLRCSRRLGWFGLFGLLSGLAILLKASTALFIVLLAAGVGIRERSRQADGGRLCKAAAWMACGVFLAFAPLLARNFLLDLPLLWTTKEGSFVFALHNVSTYPPLGGDVFTDEVLQSMADVMAKSHFSLFSTMLETVKTHGSLWHYLAYLTEKFLFVWNWFEIPNNENYYYAKLFAPVLSFLPLGFGGMAPLALTGGALSHGRWRRCWQLYLFAASNLVLLVLFFNVSRLRMPLVVGLIPFAAYLLVRLYRMAARRKYAAIGAICLVSALLALWVNRPLPAGSKVVRPSDYYLTLSLYYWPKLEDAAAKGRFQEAGEWCRESVRLEPHGELAPLLSGATSATELDLDLATIFFEANQKCADVASQAGLATEALGYREQAARLGEVLGRFRGR